MTFFVVVLILIVGVNTVIWGVVGLCRLGAARLRHRRPPGVRDRLTVDDVAILIAAHNEEQVIAATVESARSLVPDGHVFVASDGSTDQTVAISRRYGARVMELFPNRGKAGALSAAIDYFSLDQNFRVVLMLDADTRLTPDYMVTGLPLFDDPNVVAVAGRAATLTDPPPPTRVGRFLVAYRERFYVVVQYILKFGQAARPANVVSIVPGFASMYRSRVLSKIDISAPGLVIEDFNMTFEIHAKKLGRIAFDPNAAIAYTQDPDSFGDYKRQYRRWTLGFWQTIRRHGVHVGRFWFALGLYSAELITSSIMLLLVVPLMLVSLGASLLVVNTVDHTGAAAWFVGLVPPLAVLVGLVLPDYLLTIFTVIITRRPVYLLLGIGFPLMRIVDAAICLGSLGKVFLWRRWGMSNGTWTSPTRRSPTRTDAQTTSIR